MRQTECSLAASRLALSIVILKLSDRTNIGTARYQKISFSIFHSFESRSPAQYSRYYLCLLLLSIHSCLGNIINVLYLYDNLISLCQSSYSYRCSSFIYLQDTPEDAT